MLLRLQRYKFDLVFKPGSQVIIADTQSRAFPPDLAVQTKFEYEIAALAEDAQEAEIRMVASCKTINRIQLVAA